METSETGSYGDLDRRGVIGLLPKKTFLVSITAMADRGDVPVLDAARECSGRDGGDGGESNSPSSRAHDQMCYKLVRRFASRIPGLPPTKSPAR